MLEQTFFGQKKVLGYSKSVFFLPTFSVHLIVSGHVEDVNECKEKKNYQLMRGVATI